MSHTVVDSVQAKLTEEEGNKWVHHPLPEVRGETEHLEHGVHRHECEKNLELLDDLEHASELRNVLLELASKLGGEDVRPELLLPFSKRDLHPYIGGFVPECFE